MACIRDLFDEYQLGAARRKELKLKGISGSAVEPAIESSPEWLEIKQGLIASYQKRFEETKTPLLKAL